MQFFSEGTSDLEPTLLSQWAEHSDLTFAWVSLDEGDNDPKVLFSYVAAR